MKTQIDISKRTKGQLEFKQTRGNNEYEHYIYVPSSGSIVAYLNDDLPKEEIKANAAFIVTACNNYDALVSIAKTVKYWFSYEANYPEGTNGYALCKEAEAVLKSIEDIKTV